MWTLFCVPFIIFSFVGSFDVVALLRMSLGSTPKYIPSWYLYDTRGSNLFEEILRDDVHYYFKDAEMEVLQTNIKECVESVPHPCALIEFGSGSSQKTRILIDTLLDRLPVLTYVPVDISADFLQEACDVLKDDYNERLIVNMMPTDYDSAIKEMRNIQGNKIVLWLGGFQNQSVDNMKKRLKMIADSISESDAILLTIDVNQNGNEVQDAYLDPNGVCERFYRNAFDRLNREFGCNMAFDDVNIEAEFVGSLQDNLPSRVLVRARSTRKQKQYIGGLGMTLDLEEGEYINLYEGEGYSFKYTRKQMESMARSSGLKLFMFVNTSSHAALCLLKRD